MTLPAPDLAAMRQDMSGLISDWGVSTRIQRHATTRNAAGQSSGTVTSVGTELMWLQPFEGEMYRGGPTHVDAGVVDRMTHQAFERFSGAAVQADDKLLVSGDTYAYDVLAVQIVQTHRHLFLQQVKRS